MASLRGRLTGHFVGRVVVMLVGLSLVFLVWVAALSVWTFLSRRADAPPTTMLRNITRQTHASTSTVTVDAKAVASVRKAGLWLQVLDERGQEVTQVARPKGVPTHYTPGALVLYRQQPKRLGQGSLYTWSETVGGRDLTYVMAGSRPQSGAAILTTLSTGQLVGIQIGMLLAGGAVVLFVGWLFGASLARPLVHMMEWLRSLGAGDLAEPLDRDGRPASRDLAGQRRKPYATYREVFDALDGLTADLRRAEEERGRLERGRQEWMAGVSHDLRTPLSSVRGYAEVLASDYDFEPAEVRRQAALIRGQAAHMDAMLDDLNLTFRLRADALPLSRERVDLVELSREAAVDLANDQRAAGREVVFADHGVPVTAEVDPHLFRRALRNLLVNAAVHNPEGTHVRVDVQPTEGWALVTVADDGRGMDADTLAGLFDRYYRGTATRDGADGTGLGMAIARQLVEAHGGQVHVESVVGAGTTVRVWVPATA